MDLSDLSQTAAQMSDEKLQELLMEIRQNRRTAPERKAETKKAPAKKVELSLDALLASASPEMRAQLIAQLGGKT